MTNFDELAVAVNSLNEAFNAPKCDPQAGAVLTEGALIAIRRLANETRNAGEGTEVGKWRRGYDELVRGCKTRPEFLAKFADLTVSLDSAATPPDFSGLCLREASHNALQAANAKVGCRFRLDALLQAGIATGALAMLVGPYGLEASFRAQQAKRAAYASHKDDRADRAHVWDWLQKNRGRYRTDVERVDAIMAGKEVLAQRSTVARWVTEWNREQRSKAYASHKDDRADRAHVLDWLQKKRGRYRTDVERVDAIMAGKGVLAQRSTVARWVTEWNSEQRSKK